MKYYQRIRDAREALGMTQRELAASASIAPGSLSAYENGNQSPPVDVAARLAKALKVSLDWLFGMEPNEALLQKPKTYADVIRMILLITESGLTVFPGIVSNPWQTDPRINNEADRQVYSDLDQLALSRGGPPETADYASVEIYNHIVIEFFTAWLKLYELRAQGVLDDEVYSIWIEKRLKDLALEPLQYTWPEEDPAGTPAPEHSIEQ